MSTIADSASRPSGSSSDATFAAGDWMASGQRCGRCRAAIIDALHALLVARADALPAAPKAPMRSASFAAITDADRTPMRRCGGLSGRADGGKG